MSDLMKTLEQRINNGEWPAAHDYLEYFRAGEPVQMWAVLKALTLVVLFYTEGEDNE
jgi:hypothetical protein